MTTKRLDKMELIDHPKFLYCVSEGSLIHAFLEWGNVTNVWRSIVLWLRDTLNHHVKYPKLIK